MQPKALFAGFCLFALVLASCGDDSQKSKEAAVPAPPPTPAPIPIPTGASVHGQATIEMKKGQIQFLNGLGIAVVPENACAEIKKIRDDRWLMQASRSNFDDGFHNLDLDAIGGTAVAHAVTTLKADAQGRFEIHGLSPGSYRLYAQYKSRYAVGYWLVPVVIKDARQNLAINIGTPNIEEAYNLFR
ncbi:MAG: hypothetical protein PHD76_11615 [Methylacidiphilales bacterium]|nr:hypothetical protein [Candidatus Methylacidiphilales bacterium]